MVARACVGVAGRTGGVRATRADWGLCSRGREGRGVPGANINGSLSFSEGGCPPHARNRGFYYVSRLRLVSVASNPLLWIATCSGMGGWGCGSMGGATSD